MVVNMLDSGYLARANRIVQSEFAEIGRCAAGRRYNPCRKGSVQSANHWRYSSAAWYMSNRGQSVDVPLAAIAR
jgi:hypothetical protein